VGVEKFRRPRNDPGAYSAEMAKAARLNSNCFPTTAATPIGELRYAKKALSV
jgi:hypothetical protein